MINQAGLPTSMTLCARLKVHREAALLFQQHDGEGNPKAAGGTKHQKPWRSTCCSYGSRIPVWSYRWTSSSSHSKPFLLHDPYLPGALHRYSHTHKQDQIWGWTLPRLPANHSHPAAVFGRVASGGFCASHQIHYRRVAHLGKATKNPKAPVWMNSDTVKPKLQGLTMGQKIIGKLDTDQNQKTLNI